jgi:hypothetical protein
MENEDIIQSPDDLLNQSIQEQTLNTSLPITQDLTSFDIQSPDDSMIQSVEETKPYLPQQNFLEFEDIKGVIKSFLNPEETPKALTEVVSKPMKYGLFFDTANEFLEENKKQAAEKKFANEPDVIKVNSTTYIDTTTGKNLYASFGNNEIVDQALSGLLESGYSFGQLITLPLDLAFDTNLTKSLDELYEKYKYEDPDTFLEEVVKTLTEYGAPVSVITKFTSPLRKKLRDLSNKIQSKSLRRTAKFTSSVGYSAGVFGAADFIVGNPGDRDLFVEKESEEGLEGRDLAAARLRNKVRFGLEGTALGTGVNVVGKMLPIGLRYGIVRPAGKAYDIGARTANAVVVNPVSKLLSKSDVVVPAIANLIRNSSNFAKEAVLTPIIARSGLKFEYKEGLPVVIPKLVGKIPPYKEWRLLQVTDSSPIKVRLKKLDNFISYFRTEFRQPESVYKVSSRAIADLKGQSKIINSYLDDLEVKAYNLAKAFDNQYKNNTSSQGGREYYLNLVEEYIKNQTKLNSLPKELQPTALALKEKFNNVKKTFVDLLPEDDLKNEFSKVIKNYMKKSFAIFTDTEFQPPKEVLDGAIKEGIKIITKYRDMRLAAKKEFPNLPITTAIQNYSQEMIQNILRTAKSEVVDPLLTIRNIGKDILKLDKSILSGDELPIAIRKLLGEEKNLRSSLLQTTSSFLTQTSNKKLYDEVADIGLKEGWLKIGKGIDTTLQQVGRIPGLGLMDSKISKLYANPELAAAISGSKGILDSFIQNDYYRGILQFKTAVQFGKTILSPEGQIRNAVTNVGFPIMYGWIGGKTSIVDSFRKVAGDIYGAGKEFNTPAFLKDIEKLTKLGVLDDNIIAQELSAVLKQIREGKISSFDEFLLKLSKTKFITNATRTFQGGDNAWRLYSYLWNNSFLSRAFNGDLKKLIKQEELITGEKYNPISRITGKNKTFEDAVDELSSWYVKTLMPTYSEVPQVIKNLRKLPLGNFISWPAAIIQVSANGMRTALREASSDMPEIRQLGLRKLIGMFTTYGGAGYAITGLAEQLTGVSEDQINAYKRSFAPDYDKNSSLLPYSPIKDNILKIVNFSYSDVFDTVKKPIRAAIANLDKLKSVKDIDNFVFNATMDATKEFIKPFISETIALKPVLDVLPEGIPLARGGKTIEGNRIYSETDNWKDTTYKSLAHILSAAIPSGFTLIDKYGTSIYDTLTGRSKPDDLRNRFISSISGTKINNVDLQKSLDFKIGEFVPRIKKDVLATEGFYSEKDWKSRTPQDQAKEWENIQKESFEQQKQLYQLIQDAKTLKIPMDLIEDTLMKKFNSKELVRNIIDGLFTPLKFSEKKLEEKYLKIERDEKIAKRGIPPYNFIVPFNQLDKVIDKHYGISLKKDYEDAISRKQKGEGVQPGIKEVFPKIPLKQETDKQSNIQTPPLPTTPQPVTTSNITPQVNPTTKLTSVESALLSPTEQAIRQTQRS